MRAIVRRPSPRIAEGQTTHIERVPMDVAKAFAQYDAYLALLTRLGVTLIVAPEAPEHPDGLFVEDALVVIGSSAILTRPGAMTRRTEPDTLEALVRDLGLDVHRIVGPGTVDGGDVLVTDKHVFIGNTTRTDEQGIRSFQSIASATGRETIPIDVPGCLHLKSAATTLPDGSLIAVPGWVDANEFAARGLRVHEALEPSGGDVLCIGNTVILPADAPQTADCIAALGFGVALIDVSELQKVEAGVTCMSVLVPAI